MAKLQKVKCPVCDKYLDLETDLEIGDIMYCSGCDEELEIINLHPPKLKATSMSITDNYETEEVDNEDEEIF